MIKSLQLKILITTMAFIFSVSALSGEGSSLHPVRKGGKFGYANEQGKMVLSAKYTIAMDFGDGLAYVAEAADRHGSWKHGFIDERGRWVVMLDGKSFRPSSDNGDFTAYRERHDLVVFRNGFVELPSYNSTGGADFATSSVWMNRHQMMEIVERYGRETPIRPTSRVFFSRLAKKEGYILATYSRARNTKGPNGTFAFRVKDFTPVTAIQPGEENSWFGVFGTMRYTGDTYLVYSAESSEIRYFDEVTVVERNDGWVGFLAKSMDGAFVLYSRESERADNKEFASVGDFMKRHRDYSIKSSSDEEPQQQEFMSRKLLNFQSLLQMVNYYLVNDSTIRESMIPVCSQSEEKATSEVRIALRYGTLMLSGYSQAKNEAWLWDFSANTKKRVKFPLTINADGNNGNDGEAGNDGAAGRPKLTYKDGNSTKTEAGTCGEAGGNGKNGERGGDGATLLVILSKDIPAGKITITTEGGNGGKGGAGGIGGIHGVGSSCSGKAKDGAAGKNGEPGKKGVVKVVMVKGYEKN